MYRVLGLKRKLSMTTQFGHFRTHLGKLFIVSGILLLSSTANAIVSGQDVALDDPISRFTVRIKVIGGLDPEGCSGSIVDEHTILTSAHCFEGVDLYNLDNLRKSTVEFRVGERAEVRSMRKVIPHPRWNSRIDQSNDIALVRFRGELPNTAQIVAGIEAPLTPNDGDSVIIAGYGQTSAEGIGESGTLKKGQLAATSGGAKPGKDLLVLKGASALCQGDSGGPALLQKDGKLTLIGVNEGVETIMCTGRSAVTRIMDHIDWIREKIRVLEGK